MFRATVLSDSLLFFRDFNPGNTEETVAALSFVESKMQEFIEETEHSIDYFRIIFVLDSIHTDDCGNTVRKEFLKVIPVIGRKHASVRVDFFQQLGNRVSVTDMVIFKEYISGVFQMLKALFTESAMCATAQMIKEMR